MTSAAPAPPVPGRPRPVVNRDNAFFWAGVARGELLVQRCTRCGRLRHPPGPMCPWCQSLQWAPHRCSGDGIVHSFVIIHRPLPPGFASPHAVVLADMAEGWRLVAGMSAVDPHAIAIGQPVVTRFVEVEEGLVLPDFSPAHDGGDPR